MAVDKLIDSTQLDADLTSVANAIRSKADISGTLAFPSGFVTAIGNIVQQNGLEYEEGTYIPTEDVNRPTINFANSHTKPAFLIALVHLDGDPLVDVNYAQAFYFIDVYQLLGVGYPSSTSGFVYANAIYIYSASLSYASSGNTMIQTKYNNDNDSSYTTYRYWSSKEWFKPYASPVGATQRPFKKDHTYKWIALWK